MLNKIHLKFIVLFSLVISYSPFLFSHPSTDATSTAVRGYHVSLYDVPQKISVVGKLQASHSVDVASEVTGKVVFIRANVNKDVTQGDLLVKIDDRKALSLLSEARDTLNNEQRILHDDKKLAKKNVLTKTAVDGQQSVVDIAKARYEEAKIDAEDHLLRAPFSGELGLTNFSIGKMVNLGDELFTLDALSVMQLDLDVPEHYLSHLKTGLSVSMTTAAWKNQSFAGQIVAVNSRVDPDTLSLSVRVKLNNANKQLKPGMLMLANINFPPIKEMTIPIQALEYLGEKHFVYIISHGVVKRTEVTLGQQVNNQVAITHGLAVGDEIVVQGLVNMRDGIKVHVLPNKKTKNSNEGRL
ncbi:MAG: efflux RND transporter periplasmic adaptor subunit [Psychromonas sp.]|nr:efflux RND transporter periplasmic adaptor subunit [Psychromonas sp.]